MELAEFRFRLDTSPTLRLLRSSNAAEVLRFLHTSFKAEYRLSIPSDELTAKLQTYLETEVHPSAPLTLPDETRAYLEQWCRDDVGWLRRYYEGDEPVFELSADAERALQWMYGSADRTQRQRKIDPRRTSSETALSCSNPPFFA